MKMVKRSREDFDTPSTTESRGSQEPGADLPSPISRSESTVNATDNSKLLHIDIESGEVFAPTEVMRCSLPPHTRQVLSFASFEDYEVHYNKMHINRCVECRKNFPTSHFLDLHISENHNPLIDVLKDRGERTYACFVEDCDRKCSTPQKRRMHLIDKHIFPKEYDFYVVNDGIDQRSSMLRSGRHRRRSSAAQHKTEIEDRIRRRASVQIQATEENFKENVSSTDGSSKGPQAGDSDVTGPVILNSSQPDSEMDDLSGAMSALKFVPTSKENMIGKCGNMKKPVIEVLLDDAWNLRARDIRVEIAIQVKEDTEATTA